MQNTANLVELFSLNSFVLHRNFDACYFLDKMKVIRNGPCKIITKPTKVTYELVKKDGNTVHTHCHQLISYYSKEHLFIPHI